ncbi:hypothetical protein ACFSQ7_13625 [Paenibacillus rhizoplanae]
MLTLGAFYSGSSLPDLALRPYLRFEYAGPEAGQRNCQQQKQIATFQMEKQTLEQTIVPRAKEMGFVVPSEDSTIYVPLSSQATDKAGK